MNRDSDTISVKDVKCFFRLGTIPSYLNNSVAYLGECFILWSKFYLMLCLQQIPVFFQTTFLFCTNSTKIPSEYKHIYISYNEPTNCIWSTGWMTCLLPYDTRHMGTCRSPAGYPAQAQKPWTLFYSHVYMKTVGFQSLFPRLDTFNTFLKRSSNDHKIICKEQLPGHPQPVSLENDAFYYRRI